MRKLPLLHVVFAVVTVYFAYESAAYAYIDPGTGTFLWQIILSSLAGSLFFIQRLRQGIARLMHLKGHTGSNGKSET